MRGLCRSVGIFALLWALASPVDAQSAQAQIERSADFERAPGAGHSPLDNWWFGAYFRHLWVPSYMVKPFFDRAPSLANFGGGLQVTYRSDGGLSLVMSAGFMPYDFKGPILADGEDDQDTEIIDSDLAFYHLGASLLWDVEFHEAVALELGFGLDFGILGGAAVRTEARPDGDRYVKCQPDPDRMMNPVPGQSLDPAEMVPAGERPYCDSVDITTDAGKEGEHYGVKEDAIPPVMAFPMVPHIALRIKPVKHMAIKLEFGFGIIQMWVGASLHGSFGMFASEPAPVPEVEPDTAPVEPDAVDVVDAEGRVLGRVLEQGTDAPIAGATVRLTARALSPLSTLDDGRFVVDRLPSGMVEFEIEHPDYEPGRCSVEIPQKGGDAVVNCRLTAKPRLGAISGKVQTVDGQPVVTDRIELDGPQDQQLSSDAQGAFAAVDLPEGRYRIRVDADDYLLQIVDIDVVARETTTPQIVLIKKPKKSLVKLQEKEIVISQQIQFKTGSAEIEAASDDLMREIADVLLRNEQVRRVEIQGHTDSRGSHEFNMRLSQERADAVRNWLLSAGVGPERLVAKGYGPDHPLRPNNTAKNRAKNRRVQFIIEAQGD